MKTIDTLVEDIYSVLKGGNGWSGNNGSFLGEAIAFSSNRRFSKQSKPRRYLSLSSVGSSCERKLWLRINGVDPEEEVPGPDLLKFFYGDMVEELVLSLASAAGHSVVGQQDELVVDGVRGHRDCVIDGMTVDVKTASPYSFKKFVEGTLHQEDSFGYLSQLSSYVYAAKNDPLVTDKTRGAFLVINKVSGEICLDIHDFSNTLEEKPQEISKVRAMVKSDKMPDRLAAVPMSKTSPNTKLCTSCTFCGHKKTCWPEMRVFQYSNGPVYLVDVVSEPNVPEVTDAAF